MKNTRRCVPCRKKFLHLQANWQKMLKHGLLKEEKIFGDLLLTLLKCNLKQVQLVLFTVLYKVVL